MAAAVVVPEWQGQDLVGAGDTDTWRPVAVGCDWARAGVAKGTRYAGKSTPNWGGGGGRVLRRGGW